MPRRSTHKTDRITVIVGKMHSVFGCYEIVPRQKLNNLCDLYSPKNVRQSVLVTNSVFHWFSRFIKSERAVIRYYCNSHEQIIIGMI